MVHLSLYFSPVSASPPCGDAHSIWASRRLSSKHVNAQPLSHNVFLLLLQNRCESLLTAPFYYGNLHRKPSWTFVQRSQTGNSATIDIGVFVHAGNVAIDTTKITTIYGNLRWLRLCSTVSFALEQIITIHKIKSLLMFHSLNTFPFPVYAFTLQYIKENSDYRMWLILYY